MEPKQLGVSVVGVADRVTAHQLVQGDLAGLVELMAARGVQRDAALPLPWSEDLTSSPV